MELKVIKAGNGDSLLLKFEDINNTTRNILIDGGNKKYDYDRYLKNEILELKRLEENIDLLIITHNDQDHIKGIEYLLEDSDIDKNIIKSIWFNYYKNKTFSNVSDPNYDVSTGEATKVQNLINKHKIPSYNKTIDTKKSINFFGSKITLLSPSIEILAKYKDKVSADISGSSVDYGFTISELIKGNPNIHKGINENLDNTFSNATSIAFLFEHNDKSLLLLGDALPEIIENNLKLILSERNLETIKIDLIKLSHHGSSRSSSISLLNLIDCNKFIISTNGKKANLPNKLLISKILFRNLLNFSEEEKKDYGFETLAENYKNGYSIKL
jgi:beta-lactamase superfamily II metal-dependent hydrolase